MFIFAKLLKLEYSEEIFAVFKSSCHLPTSLLRTVVGYTLSPFNAERQAGKLLVPIL